MKDEKIDEVERDIGYFEKMIAGAENITVPWKTAVKLLVFALIASNLMWATVHFYWIYKAYNEPFTCQLPTT